MHTITQPFIQAEATHTATTRLSPEGRQFLQSLPTSTPLAVLRTYSYTIVNFCTWLEEMQPTLTDAQLLGRADLEAFLASPTRPYAVGADHQTERLVLEEYLAYAHCPREAEEAQS